METHTCTSFMNMMIGNAYQQDTRPCRCDPLKPFFYIVKLVCRGTHFFLILLDTINVKNENFTSFQVKLVILQS